jgi:hypothetical protein
MWALNDCPFVLPFKLQVTVAVVARAGDEIGLRQTHSSKERRSTPAVKAMSNLRVPAFDDEPERLLPRNPRLL